MFFDGWAHLGRVAVMAVCGYAALVVLLRLSGKRTLSKMNAFDFVVTIAFGSMLSTIILSKDIAYVEGVLGLGLLIALQYLMTWASARSARVKQLVTAQPVLLMFRGRFLDDVMRRERVTEEEVTSALRAQGVASVEDVEAVIMETAGDLTVIRREPRPSTESTFEDARARTRHVQRKLHGSDAEQAEGQAH